MTKRELKKHYVIKNAVEGNLTVKQAAERLSLSHRRIKQLKKEFIKNGVVAVIHGNSSKPSPKKLSRETENKILNIRHIPALQNSNFKHFHEIISEQYSIKVSYSSVYRVLTKNGQKSPKQNRRPKKKVHPTRERKPAEGMMLQADATPFEWFGTDEKFSLHGFIDDATGKITGLYLCKNECLLGYLEVLRQTLTTFGIPQSLYPDRYSVFFVNSKKELDLSIEEQLEGTQKKVTQFGRIIEQLGIDMFPAHSPEAKGRIERLWNTLQSRLPVEFALNNITSMSQANIFLQDFICRFNEQFSVLPSQSFSAFIPLPHTVDLDRLLSVKFSRKLSKGSTVSVSGVKYLIEQNKFPVKTHVDILLSEKHGIRALIQGSFYPMIPLDPITKAKSSVLSPTVAINLIERFLLQDAKK